LDRHGLGLLALTRENALLLAIPVLLWIGWRNRAALLFLAGLAAVLLPVGVRNLAMGGGLQLTTAQSGPNFYIGNHAGARGSYEPLVVGHGNATDEREDATRIAEQAERRKLTPGEVSSYWTSQSLKFIAARPGEWLALVAASRPSSSTPTKSPIPKARTSTPNRYGYYARPRLRFRFAARLAVFGAVVSWPHWRSLGWLYGVALAYAASVVLFYVLARYRLPIVPVLLLIAASGLVHRKRLVAGAVAGLVIASLAHWPIEESRAARATHYFAIATEFSRDAAAPMTRSSTARVACRSAHAVCSTRPGDVACPHRPRRRCDSVLPIRDRFLARIRRGAFQPRCGVGRRGPPGRSRARIP